MAHSSNLFSTAIDTISSTPTTDVTKAITTTFSIINFFRTISNMIREYFENRRAQPIRALKETLMDIVKKTPKITENDKVFKKIFTEKTVLDTKLDIADEEKKLYAGYSYNKKVNKTFFDEKVNQGIDCENNKTNLKLKQAIYLINQFGMTTQCNSQHYYLLAWLAQQMERLCRKELIETENLKNILDMKEIIQHIKIHRIAQKSRFRRGKALVELLDVVEQILHEAEIEKEEEINRQSFQEIYKKIVSTYAGLRELLVGFIYSAFGGKELKATNTPSFNPFSSSEIQDPGHDLVTLSLQQTIGIPISIQTAEKDTLFKEMKNSLMILGGSRFPMRDAKPDSEEQLRNHRKATRAFLKNLHKISLNEKGTKAFIYYYEEKKENSDLRYKVIAENEKEKWEKKSVKVKTLILETGFGRLMLNNNTAKENEAKSKDEEKTLISKFINRVTSSKKQGERILFKKFKQMIALAASLESSYLTNSSLNQYAADHGTHGILYGIGCREEKNESGVSQNLREMDKLLCDELVMELQETDKLLKVTLKGEQGNCSYNYALAETTYVAIEKETKKLSDLNKELKIAAEYFKKREREIGQAKKSKNIEEEMKLHTEILSDHLEGVMVTSYSSSQINTLLESSQRYMVVPRSPSVSQLSTFDGDEEEEIPETFTKDRIQQSSLSQSKGSLYSDMIDISSQMGSPTPTPIIPLSPLSNKKSKSWGLLQWSSSKTADSSSQTPLISEFSNQKT